MENLSHSLSKKAYSANGVGGKTVYDDVFGGPPKFGVPTLSPRVEDYTEIFGGFHASRASSIPILDLPAFDDADFSFDVRSAHFDYSEVFGGFNSLDSFEELFSQSKATYDSSDEAWTPAQSECLSDESDPFACPESKQSLSNREFFQSSSGVKQFNVSYNRVSQRSKEDMSDARAHVTQLHAVPGFTFIVNETPSQKMVDRETLLQVIDDLNPNVDFHGRPREGKKQLRKAISHPLNSSVSVENLETDLKPEGHGKTASCMTEGFVTVSAISLRTQPSQLPPPSRLPPALAVKDEDTCRLRSKLKVSKSFSCGETEGDSSPPFFDVEVDASSSAAVSAALMKDAMEKAQAKLKSAKELMGRKKEGLQSRSKLGLKNNTKDEGKSGKAFDESNCFIDQIVHVTCERDFRGMNPFSEKERQKVTKTTQVSDSIKGEKQVSVAKISAEKKHRKESRSSEEHYKADGTVAWREAAQFYEVVETEKSRKNFELANNEKNLVQNTQLHEFMQENKATPAFELREGDEREIKADREAHEWDGDKGKKKATTESNGKEEPEKMVNKEVCKQEAAGKKPRIAQRHREIEKILTEVDKSEVCVNLAEVRQNGKVEKNLNEATERIQGNKGHKDAHEGEENECLLKETLQREKRLKEAIQQAVVEKRLKIALDQEEKRKQQREACEREETEKGQKEAREREENEKRLKEAWEREENEKRLKDAREREDNEKRLKEAREREEYEKRLKDALEQEENKQRMKEMGEQEQTEKRLRMAFEREENEKRLREVLEQEYNGKDLQETCEGEESEERAKEAFKKEEIEKRSEEANEFGENQKRIHDAGLAEEHKGSSKYHVQNEPNEMERKLTADIGMFVHPEVKNFKASDGACKLDDYVHCHSDQATLKQGENSLKVKNNKGAVSFDEDRTMRAKPSDSEGQVETVEVMNMPYERFNSSDVAQDDPQHPKDQIPLQDSSELPHLHDTLSKSVEAGIGIGIGIGQTRLDENKKASETATTLGKPNVFAYELGERGTNVKEAQVTFDKEESKDQILSSQVRRESTENGRKMKADQQTAWGGKRNEQGTAQKVSTSQKTETKEKSSNDILTREEREKEEGIKREREVENERLKKLEEEWEREREREKDRMAIDRATLEARERAFVEGRERVERAAVERATAEVRQRAIAEARERLEKASAEARERSLADKASMEARLRAERSAVERATAEARERAFQKAMGEKANFEAREHVERSFADKSHSSLKNVEMRQSSSFSDMQCQGIGSSSSYSYSSVPGGVEGESAQRCKARLERHQRTAERAAKALAEKNRRDILAQREQAERNRFSEALDAEVKRWSSGKEGNLRALLSTLQYILGLDSGWHPIPLTEVITSAAVKKAYRKATLCVHPDKLQQRGASIQQKYICEKVFDLLKEAWNKFNSEER